MKVLIMLAALMTAQAFAGTDTFKMYTTRNAKPNPGCDVYLEMKFTKKANSAVVHLTNKLSGFCEIYVEPNPRTYKLANVSNSCGSALYATQQSPVSLIDNRRRICEDVIPALMVLQEKGVTYYSHDARPAKKPSTRGFCTADINSYGYPSACSCDENGKYNSTTGKCE